MPHILLQFLIQEIKQKHHVCLCILKKIQYVKMLSTISAEVDNYISGRRPQWLKPLPQGSHVAEHVQQIRNKKSNAHLFLQQPVSQPWVVLDELLIAQTVLDWVGYVTHPNSNVSVHCTLMVWTRTRCCCKQYSKLRQQINTLMEAWLVAVLALWWGGCRGRLQTVQDESDVAMVAAALWGRGSKLKREGGIHSCENAGHRN